MLALLAAVALPLVALGLVPNDRRAADVYWLGYVMGLLTLILLYAAGALGTFR